MGVSRKVGVVIHGGLLDSGEFLRYMYRFDGLRSDNYCQSIISCVARDAPCGLRLINNDS